MVSTFISLLDIQSWWEIPCIAHFCSLFSSAFNLPDIDIEDLESALLTDGTEDTVGLLPELIVCLLKGCDALKNRNEITTSNYQMFLRRFLRQQCREHNTKNYFDTDIDFQSLPLRNKLLILYSLCHFRLESSNVQTILANLEADSLRVEPLGYDSKNSGYWYFYGTRLYREDSKPGGKSTVWQVICFTEEDWSNLASKFKDSTSPKERALFKILTENFIPKLPQLFRERERLRRRKLLQVRCSARIHSIVQEKQKLLSEKVETEEIQRQKSEEELKSQAANKFRTRTRRRSQSSSIASGISTYASSLRASTPSSEFLTQHETFCLSPDLGDREVEIVGKESNSPDHSSYSNHDDCLDIKEVDSSSSRDGSPLSIKKESPRSGRVKVVETEDESNLEFPQFTQNFVDENFEKKINKSIANKRDRQKRKSGAKSRERNRDSKSESGTESKLAEKTEAMAPTTNIKLPGRQTNNSLSSIPENLFLPSVLSNPKDLKSKSKATKSIVNTKSKEKEKDKREEKKSTSITSTDSNSSSQKKKKSKSETYTEKDEILQIGMHKVLLYVKNHRDAWPFMDPVDEEIAPRYYSIIRRPMDLLKMEEKLDNEEYKKYSEFRNDFKLIVNNCRLYNGQNNEYTEMVNNLQEAFDKATKKYLDQHSSDEDESFEYPDSRTNVFREKAFSKINTPKIAQKEMSKDVLLREKEKVKRVNHNESEEIDEDEPEKPAENRSGKKKRKDKDKRRKKKLKAKPQHTTAESDEHENVTEKSGEESDTTPNVANKVKKRLSDMSKLKELVPPMKRAKTKSISVGKEQSDSEITEEVSQKETDKKNRKQKSSKQSGKTVGNGSVIEKELKDEKSNEVAENIAEPLQLDQANTQPRIISKRRHHPNVEAVDILKKKAASEEIGMENKMESIEKFNQNAKSKFTKSNPNTKESMKKEIQASKTRQTKDNKKPSSSGANKKRKGRRRKIEETKTFVKEEFEEAKAADCDENDVDEDASDSRSPSPPLFKVDLHEKYAKSASIKDEESSCDEVKCKSGSPVTGTPRKANQEDDLMSITSQSLSRSASPFNSGESDEAESEKSKQARLDEMSGKAEETSEEAVLSAYSAADSTPSSFFYLDKYDLIKQRRNRNTEEKWKQIVKDNKKSSQNKPPLTSHSKEKNQKLKETIEKLKVKNAKSKERSVLIDEIFGVKPAQQPRDEKMIYEKLRESCLDAKPPPLIKNNNLPVTSAAEPAKEPAQDAYDFVDELEPVKAIAKQKPVPSSDKSSSSDQKAIPKKETISKMNPRKPAVASANKTNLEALELETEQTLKDINRWLEHTPRFPEFSSASNSPSRYNLLDDFDAVASKIDPADFRRPVSISAAKLESVGIDEIADNNKQEIIEDLIPPVPTTNTVVAPTGAVISSTTSPATNTISTCFVKPRECSGTTQFLAHPPPPPHIKSQQQKESKRKTLKEKLASGNRRKDILRTIDRLQPGKAKGNLIGVMHSGTKIEELFPPATTNKIKEVKNSLVVKTNESGPKLSMGSVLQTEEFDLGHLHNFTKAENEKKLNDGVPVCEKDELNDEPVVSLDIKKDEVETPKNVDIEKHVQKSADKFTATPNLSAWFKAFGTPKKAKKLEEEEKKAAEAASSDISQNTSDRPNSEQAINSNCLNTMKSPPTATETFSLPAPRQRKSSTGSNVSERSSFSQDPDSPRVGIDDRFGAFAGPYASPIGASPIMVSPKPDEIGKPTSPYPLNGAIKVGFYQDTTTKSSPEKSCSPRELPSPYPQYSQHLYSTASSPTVNAEATNAFGGCYNASPETNKTQGYNAAPTSALFEQYKQPRSQESDYNSMSPNTNSNSPYQQPQSSPYQQSQTSPYQQQNSPYQQSQNSPFQNQSNTSSMIGSSPNSPNMTQSTQQPQGESPRSQSHSPYHQQTNSPYQQPTNSYQNSTPPYQTSTPQQNIGFLQQPQQPATNNPPNMAESCQRQPSDEPSFRPEPPSYSLHENSPANQFQTANRISMPSFETDISKQNKNDTNNMLNKIQQNAEWNSQIDLSISQSHQPERSPVTMSNLSSTVQPPTQLNTPPLQTDQCNPVQNDKTTSMQYGNYAQFGGSSQKDNTKAQNMFVGDMSLDINIGMQSHQQDKNISQRQQHQGNLKVQQHESSILNLGSYSDSTHRQQKSELGQNQIHVKEQYDSVQKHQQMFDSFLGSMTGNKNINLGKSMDIGPSKAFEMFNRAATMGFTKDFSSPLAQGQQKTNNAPLSNNQQQPQLPQTYQLPSNEAKTMDSSSVNSVTQNNNKPLNMANSSYQQQIQQHIPDSVTNKMSTFPTPMSDPANDMNKLQQHPQAQQLTATNYSNSDKISQEGILASTARQEQMNQIARNQQLNMDLAGYKTYNNPTAMLDPLRNLNHPLSMMDEGLLGISGSSAPAGYYEKNIPPAAHMFSKNLSQPMYQNTSTYVASSREQIPPNVYGSAPTTNVNTPQVIETFDAKQTKRKKKKTTASIVPDITSNVSSMPPTQQQSLQVQSSQSTQGFQLYSDLKTASSGGVATDSSAISLKTASSMVPGSAFNFGPTPAGLGLPTAMYGDNTSYLDPYYLSSGHRTTTEGTAEKSNSTVAATAPATPYQFLAHNPVRPTYPFMNSQLDPNSPIYQQYIQRQEQELRARMMINQGLLGSTPGAPGSFPQAGYRPPTLGMPKHYDISRQTWF